MKTKRALFSAVLAAVLPSTALAEVKTEEVTYEHEGTKMKGFIAWDDDVKGERPGVLVVHEWWGHNDYARSRAEKLAEMGYTALALDMYGGGKQASHPKDAQKFSSMVMSNMGVAKGRFLAAREVLTEHETVNDDEIAAIGYCFGGAVVLTMARAGVELDLVASFHGSLGLPKRTADSIDAHLLIFHGGADEFVKPKQVQSVVADAMKAGAKLTFISYPKVVHAFTNPNATKLGEKFGLPLAYDEAADKASWSELSDALEEAF